MSVLDTQTTQLREEANIEPDPVHTGEVKSETQIIAIYGKGGSGKSFALANLSYMMAQQGKKVLLIGCDPKSDTTSLLFGGKACPTIIETSSKKKAAGEPVAIGDVCFKRDGVFAMELGGPEVGRGCGGRGLRGDLDGNRGDRCAGLSGGLEVQIGHGPRGDCDNQHQGD